MRFDTSTLVSALIAFFLSDPRFRLAVEAGVGARAAESRFSVR
jgi:hypothetical protein